MFRYSCDCLAQGGCQVSKGASTPFTSLPNENVYGTNKVLFSSFSGCLHAIAVKANPLPALLNIVKEKVGWAFILNVLYLLQALLSVAT